MFYIHSDLDRAAHLRPDTAAIDTLFGSHSSVHLPIHQGKVLSASANGSELPVMMMLEHGQTTATGNRTFLGMADERAYFAIDCGSLSDTELDTVCRQAISCDGQEVHSTLFTDLRNIGPHLNHNQGSILAYARALVYWQNNANFCTRCGSPLENTHSGHVNICTNTDCALQVFPRTDPAVIMLVHDGNPDPQKQRCLLGNNPNWPKGVYSTLAGFVEPGESLEQAVQREVLEETNIQVHKVIYSASQPWPFPRSIMLGFHATALNTDVTIDPTELAEANWFTRAELKKFGTWGDDAFGQQMPRTDSIARFLIDQWLDDNYQA